MTSGPSAASRHSQPSAEVSPKVLRRAVTASGIGNATEWFDYGVYAYVAAEIGHSFFPGEHEMLGALLGFAVSFVLRPLGGIVWGPLGDRLGRSTVLTATILLMCSSTFLVGLIPSYQSIGIWAPVLLILLRIVQGFSTGGEYGGAATFMAEFAPNDRRGFWGSFLEFGTIAGFTTALLLVAGLRYLLGADAMSDWGWRVPFLIAGPLGGIGVYMRLKLEDTPVFRDLEERGHVHRDVASHFRHLFGVHWRPVVQLFGLVLALNVANYTLLAYMPTYLSHTVGMSRNHSEMLLLIGQLCMMALMPVAGILSDRIGRKACWWISLVGLFALAAPMFMLMANSLVLAIVGFTVLGLVYVLQLGTISATFPAMFPAHVRYAGMAISYNVATAVFGGTAPAANDMLIDLTGNALMPAFYMMGACLIGMIALYPVIETRGASLHGIYTPGSAHATRAHRQAAVRVGAGGPG
jgi:MFS transporter, MHS family, proline/betaine transporter